MPRKGRAHEKWENFKCLHWCMTRAVGGRKEETFDRGALEKEAEGGEGGPLGPHHGSSSSSSEEEARRVSSSSKYTGCWRSIASTSSSSLVRRGSCNAAISGRANNGDG